MFRPVFAAAAACVLAAAGGAPEEACPEGLCRLLSQDSAEGAGLEFVQLQVIRAHGQENASGIHAISVSPDAETEEASADDRPAAAAPPRNGTGGVRLVQQSATANKSRALLASNASDERWPSREDLDNIVHRVVPGAVSAAAQAAAAAFAAVLNGSLVLLDERAEAFLEDCTSFKELVLSNVSKTGDRKIEALQGLVRSYVGPLERRWELVAGTASDAGPHVVRGIAGLGLQSFASEAQAVLDRINVINGHITNVLRESSEIVERLGDASEGELDRGISRLNSTVSYGIQEAQAFEEQLDRLIRRSLDGVAQHIGVSLNLVERLDDGPGEIKALLEGLVQQASSAAGKVSAGVRDYLHGTFQAAELALAPVPQNSGAQRSSSLLSAALAACAWRLLP